MGTKYAKNFENILNKSESARQKQAEYVDKYNEDSELYNTTQRKMLAMKDGLLKSGTLTDILAGAGLVVKESDTYSIYMNIDSTSDEASVDEAAEERVYDPKITFLDYEDLGVEMVMFAGKIYKVKVELYFDGALTNNKSITVDIRDTLQDFIVFSNNKLQATGKGTTTFMVKCKYDIPVTASDFIVRVVDKSGFEEAYICTLSLYSKTSNTLAKLKDYTKLGVNGYHIWNPEAIIDFLDILNVTKREISNIIAQCIADPKYKKLTNPVELAFICTPVNDMDITEKTQPTLGYYESAELTVGLAKDIIDSIISLEEFRENIKRIVSMLDYKSALILGEHFKFRYEVKMNALSSGSPVIFNSITQFKESLTITKTEDDTEIVITPQEAYGIKVNTLSENIDVVQFFHHMFDNVVGVTVVDEIITKHEKMASEGALFGITKASIGFGLKKGLTNFMNTAISAAKKKMLGDLTSKVDGYKSNLKTKSALSSKSTQEFTTGNETPNTKAYFENMSESLKENKTASMDIDTIQKNIVYSKKIDTAKVDGTPLSEIDDLLYKEIKLDGHIEFILPNTESTCIVLLYNRTRTATELGFEITETKSILIYNLVTKNIDQTVYTTKGTWLETYICIQKDIVKHTPEGIQLLLADNGLERISFMYMINKDAATGYYTIGTIIKINNYLKYDWAYRVNISGADTELPINDPETEKISYEILDWIYLDNVDPEDPYKTFILDTLVTSDRAEGKNKAIPAIGMVLSQDYKYRYMTLVADNAGYAYIKPLDINILKGSLDSTVSTTMIPRLRRMIGYTYLDDDTRSTVLSLYKTNNIDGIKLTVQDKVADPKESFFINDLETLRVILLQSFDISGSVLKDKITNKLKVTQSDTHLPSINSKMQVFFNYVEKAVFYITKEIDADNKIKRHIDKYSYEDYTYIKGYDTFGDRLIGGSIYGISNMDPIGYNTDNIDNIYKLTDTDISIGSTVYKLPSRGMTDRSITPAVADTVTTSSYIYTDGATKLNNVVKTYENIETKVDSATSGSKDKVKQLLSDSKDTTEITITITLPTPPKRTITCKDITLTEVANLQASVEAQQEMYTDIFNELTEAKEKVNKAKNKHKKYFVTNYLPKQ